MNKIIHVSVSLDIQYPEGIDIGEKIQEVLSQMDYDFNYCRDKVIIVGSRINGQIEEL